MSNITGISDPTMKVIEDVSNIIEKVEQVWIPSLKNNGNNIDVLSIISKETKEVNEWILIWSTEAGMTDPILDLTSSNMVGELKTYLLKMRTFVSGVMLRIFDKYLFSSSTTLTEFLNSSAINAVFTGDKMSKVYGKLYSMILGFSANYLEVDSSVEKRSDFKKKFAVARTALGKIMRENFFHIDEPRNLIVTQINVDDNGGADTVSSVQNVLESGPQTFAIKPAAVGHVRSSISILNSSVDDVELCLAPIAGQITRYNNNNTGWHLLDVRVYAYVAALTTIIIEGYIAPGALGDHTATIIYVEALHPSRIVQLTTNTTTICKLAIYLEKTKGLNEIFRLMLAYHYFLSNDQARRVPFNNVLNGVTPSPVLDTITANPDALNPEEFFSCYNISRLLTKGNDTVISMLQVFLLTMELDNKFIDQLLV